LTAVAVRFFAAGNETTGNFGSAGALATTWLSGVAGAAASGLAVWLCAKMKDFTAG
jgi:hypothetical protein